MKTRRDYTNASGYICPTENTAIYNADRGIKDSYTAPMTRPKVFDMVHTHIISCDFDGPAGVYDENEEE